MKWWVEFFYDELLLCLRSLTEHMIWRSASPPSHSSSNRQQESLKVPARQVRALCPLTWLWQESLHVVGVEMFYSWEEGALQLTQEEDFSWISTFLLQAIFSLVAKHQSWVWSHILLLLTLFTPSNIIGTKRLIVINRLLKQSSTKS